MPHASPLDVTTPALLLSLPRLERNCVRMQERLASLGAPLRPHGKTAKSIDACRIALRGESCGLTVSTLAEAEYFSSHGVTDMIYAVGFSPEKVDRIADLTRRGAIVRILVEDDNQVKRINDAFQSAGVVAHALIEIDCDGERAGLRADSDSLPALARVIAGSQHIQLAGVLTHGGGSYHCNSASAIEAMAEQERAAAVHAAERLRADGHACEIVSVGSTPTAHFARGLSGVTEVRAGTYMFQDLVMTSLGVCTPDDIAISVLTTVIGHQEDKGWLIVDAGWMSLAKDVMPADSPLAGYGLARRLDGPDPQELFVTSVNQEHGIVVRRDGGPLAARDYPIGSRLRILPVHACATAAMHDYYHVLDDSEKIIARWDRCRGW